MSGSERLLPRAGILVALLHIGGPAELAGQTGPAQADSIDEVTAVEAASGMPFFATAALGYGQRFDGCGQCPNLQTRQSFTGHLSVGKYMVDGLGIGLDASVWQRGHPGAPAADSTGALVPTSLVGRVGNASLTLSFQEGHLFVRAGVGVALGQQDMQDTDGVVSTATGYGVGYTVGGGATIPLASLISIACFVNWNAGSYDLQSPIAVVERGARHSFFEAGFGLTIR